MEFMYKYGLPDNQELLLDVNSAANRLAIKVKNLDMEEFDISILNKRYFGNKLKNVVSNLRIYSYLLSWALAKFDVSINKCVFIDYGGGSGMLSLLAKELGVGTVIYNDIYDVCCRDAKIIAESIGNEADHYVQGDIEDVLYFLRTRNINCNAIASYDVIEHVYDIETFFRRIPYLSDGPLTVVMSSGANTFNPLIRRGEIKHQLEVEYKGREKSRSGDERDCLKAYIVVRREMIYKYLQELDTKLHDDEITKLAGNSRGLAETDIRKYVDEYLKKGKLPSEPNHPTNTCDPHTGSWAERLMDPYYLRDILSKKGFEVNVLKGYYGRPHSPVKRLLASFLNMGIYMLKKEGLRIAPFYTIYGRRN